MYRGKKKLKKHALEEVMIVKLGAETREVYSPTKEQPPGAGKKKGSILLSKLLKQLSPSKTGLTYA